MVAALNVLLERSIVVEEIESDRLDTLILEIEQRSVNAAAIGIQMNVFAARTGSFTRAVTHGPVILPIDPRERAKSHRSLAAATSRRIFLDFAQKSLRALIGNFTESRDDIRRTIR